MVTLSDKQMHTVVLIMILQIKSEARKFSCTTVISEFVGSRAVDGWLVVLKLIKSLYGAGTLNSYLICCVQCWNPAPSDIKRKKYKLSLCGPLSV